MKLNPPNTLKPIIREIKGVDTHRVIVIDDLLADPMETRRLALNLDLQPNPDSFYPGISTPPTWDCSSLYFMLCDILARKIEPSQINLQVSAVTTKPKDLSPMQTRPHADGCTTAGLIYLNPPEQCSGGTAFYRHKATGFEWLPSEFRQHHYDAAQRVGLTVDEINTILKAEPKSSPQDYITDSNDEWELIDQIPMQFNRFLLYTGDLFHSAYYQASMFGDAVNQRRRTLNFFVW